MLAGDPTPDASRSGGRAAGRLPRRLARAPGALHLLAGPLFLWRRAGNSIESTAAVAGRAISRTVRQGLTWGRAWYPQLAEQRLS